MYQQPPEPISQILDAEPTPFVSVSPDQTWLLFLERNALPTIEEVSAPELGLAGMRIDPTTNGPSRTTSLNGLRLRSIDGETERRIETPEKARIGNVSWSDDNRSIAFTITSQDGIALWVADVETGKARALTAPRLNASYGRPFSWMPGGDRLVVKWISEERGEAPEDSRVPSGPVVQQTEGRVAPTRTYQDLLANATDEARFDHYFQSQIAILPLEGDIEPIGEPGVHLSVDPSPDGKFFLVETLHRPYSYLVPASRFPRKIEVWNLEGESVYTLVDRPLQEEVPIAFDAEIQGPRNATWRNDAEAVLVWSEVLDEGDPEIEADHRDRLLALAAPFDAEPQPLLDVEFRLAGTTWSRGDLALVSERWWKTRWTRTWIIEPDNPEAEPRLLFDRSSEDRYEDPGSFVTAVGPLGTNVLLTTDDGQNAFLRGQGASDEGDRPFFDRIDLESTETERLWRSEGTSYETIVEPLDHQGKSLITRRESIDDPPNYFLRDLESGDLTRLTDFEDPAPQLAGLKAELIRYERADGVELSAKLYLPPGYDKSQGPIPFLLWAYPREFRSASAASQVSGSPYQFTRPSGSSHLFLLTQGYGILDGPAMPIVGEGDAEPNDTYIEQLVSSAQAAVDKIVELGVADPDRVAVGGHSYGAFMTANLLAHSEIFRAGIARSGAYNRTLTPFGFQAEERPFWQARDIYMSMSPFTYADQIQAPILILHGMADNNSGTFPVQSERLYTAIKGNGGTARLVMLPAESHGYQARESVGHCLWEMVSWLDQHVKSSAESTSSD